MKGISVIVLAVLVACVYAQIPSRCRSPPAWEARFYSTESNSRLVRTGRFYYDADNERSSFVEAEYYDDQEVVSEQEYFFHKEKYGLRYNYKTKQCVRFNLTEPFFYIEVTPTARYLDTLVIGSNAAEELGLTVNIWGDMGRNNGRIVTEWVADDGDGDEDCLPVSVTEFGGAPGSRGFRHSSYYNIVLGVNPSHFIPPEECPRAFTPPKGTL